MEGLFCAKRKNIDEWVCGSYVRQYGKHMIYLEGADDDGFEYYHVDPETVRPFTGLYDCTKWEELTTEEQARFLYQYDGTQRSKEDWKGRPIFCGDIVKHFFRVGVYDIRSFDVGAIFWDDQKAKFMRTSNLDLCDYAVSTECAYKVIGNICDNKTTDFEAEDHSYENN